MLTLSTVFFVYSFDFDPTVRHTFWALTLGGMINWVGTFGASQQSIQRFSALPSLREAKMWVLRNTTNTYFVNPPPKLLLLIDFFYNDRAVLLNCLGLFLMVTTACLAGVSVFAYYASKGCDPYTSKEIKNTNQVMYNLWCHISGVIYNVMYCI